ncbi:MAG: uroporphyrinogen-III synthase [Mariprofundaceae bacterium]|nr:uroporphyrinogen-III synthase [Mariprofundaceae bacterium]
MTRASHQMDETAALIAQHHAIAIAFPCLELKILGKHIQQGLQQMSEFSDVLFTSVNGIEAVARNANKPLVQLLAQQRIAVVGSKTAHALHAHHLHAHIIPPRASQQGLIEAYQTYGFPQSLLFFRAEHGSDLLINCLQQQNIPVSLIKAYRSICPKADNTDVLNMLSTHSIDAVLLASPKTTAHYLERIGDLELANRPVLVGISQNVATAADKLGLKVQLIAKQPNFASMLDTLANHFSQRSN